MYDYMDRLKVTRSEKRRKENIENASKAHLRSAKLLLFQHKQNTRHIHLMENSQWKKRKTNSSFRFLSSSPGCCYVYSASSFCSIVRVLFILCTSNQIKLKWTQHTAEAKKHEIKRIHEYERNNGGTFEKKEHAIGKTRNSTWNHNQISHSLTLWQT